MRRRRWEAEVTAAAVVDKLAQAFSSDGAARESGVSTPNSNSRPAQAQANFITLADGRRARVVTPEAFLSIAGSP